MSKDGSAFCYPENIDREMRRLFAALKERQYLRRLSQEEFAHAAARFLATLNAIHPFREGNGRTQTTFLTILADHAGHPFHLERLDPEKFLTAVVESFKGNERQLEEVLLALIRPGV